jgi:hypothetical protein
MMKRLIVTCTVALTALIVGGCALSKPEFNQTYLPSSVPGAPERRIELTAAVVNKKTGSDIKAHPLSLHWIEDDNVLFSILSKDRQKSLHSFLVTRSTGQIKALEDAEKDALLSKIENKVVADKSGSIVAELAKFAMAATVAIVARGGSGSGGGERFQGKLEISGYVLDIDATVDSGKWVWAIFYSSYDCYYNIKNNKTGETLNGKAKIEKLGQWEEHESLENWLKSWRISPDGRFYLIEKTATFIVPENNDTVQTLIENYPYAALDISPKWDQIALLMVKEDEKTKQKNYWIEFYPFSYRNK